VSFFGFWLVGLEIEERTRASEQGRHKMSLINNAPVGEHRGGTKTSEDGGKGIERDRDVICDLI
jgi:hypothetical protein